MVSSFKEFAEQFDQKLQIITAFDDKYDVNGVDIRKEMIEEAIELKKDFIEFSLNFLADQQISKEERKFFLDDEKYKDYFLQICADYCIFANYLKEISDQNNVVAKLTNASFPNFQSEKLDRVYSYLNQYCKSGIAVDDESNFYDGLRNLVNLFANDIPTIQDPSRSSLTIFSPRELALISALYNENNAVFCCEKESFPEVVKLLKQSESKCKELTLVFHIFDSVGVPPHWITVFYDQSVNNYPTGAMYVIVDPYHNSRIPTSASIDRIFEVNPSAQIYLSGQNRQVDKGCGVFSIIDASNLFAIDRKFLREYVSKNEEKNLLEPVNKKTDVKSVTLPFLHATTQSVNADNNRVKGLIPFLQELSADELMFPLENGRWKSVLEDMENYLGYDESGKLINVQIDAFVEHFKEALDQLKQECGSESLQLIIDCVDSAFLTSNKLEEISKIQEQIREAIKAKNHLVEILDLAGHDKNIQKTDVKGQVEELAERGKLMQEVKKVKPDTRTILREKSYFEKMVVTKQDINEI